MNDSYTKNILDKLDKFTVINPKKELMKTIFSTYFSKSFYENETFKKLKMSFLTGSFKFFGALLLSSLLK